MAVNDPMIWIGGDERENHFCNDAFRIPLGPITAEKATAVTTVGRINGNEVINLIKFLPGNW